MKKVQQRLAAIKWLVATATHFRSEHFILIESIFIQFRKILELVAYASLSANKKAYAKARPNFHLHYKAKGMLDDVAKVNPGFYPKALEPPIKTGENSWHVPGFLTNALTREEFERLYDAASELLHMRNPFSMKDPTTDIGYSVDEWVARIERLLRWHSVQLLDGTMWTANVPEQGDVRLFPMAPAPQADQSESV